jgi:hypothetical protein
MISVITGDIINSRKSEPRLYIRLLKSELKVFGETPGDWEIYGGDSFQLRIDDPIDALLVSIRIKAAVRIVKPLDVRLAIGLGDMSFKSRRITECNGSAFINSGERFKRLKKDKLKMAVQSGIADSDRIINLCLKLGMIAMDRWSAVSAETVALALSRREASQDELGKILRIKQNAVSSRLARSHFEEIMEINKLYENFVNIMS